jgi:hypothetical protein
MAKKQSEAFEAGFAAGSLFGAYNPAIVRAAVAVQEKGAGR